MLAIVGSHGTGKTTLIEKTKKISKFSFFYNVEVARFCPYKVGLESNKKAQNWIFQTQDLVEIECFNSGKSTLLDRCLIDQYAYYRYWCGSNKYIEEYIKNECKRYSFLFYLPPNKKFLKSDGIRPTNPEFQTDIDNLIKKNLMLVPEKKIIFLENNSLDSAIQITNHMYSKGQKKLVNSFINDVFLIREGNANESGFD